MNLNRINVFIEGEKQVLENKPSDDDYNIPLETIAAYTTRLVKELLSPNKQSEHACTEICKKTYAIVIGRTNTVCCMVEIEKAVPRYIHKQILYI